MIQIKRNEIGMGRTQEFIDGQGVTWIAAARAAKIWNERAAAEYHTEGSYTRWSVYQRKGLETLPTPGGNLYREDEIRRVALRPHPKRPLVAAANRSRKKLA